MERMKVAIIGPTLNTYYGIEQTAKYHDIIALFTLPPEKAFRKARATIFDEQAKKYRFQIFYEEDKLKTSEVVNRFKNLNLDLIVEMGSSMWVPQEILESAKYGCIGSHGAKLPYIRGGASMNWAMINGEKEWGVSLFYLTPVTDEGITIATSGFSIDERDYINTVTYKSDLATMKMLDDFFRNFKPKEEFPKENLEEIHINPSPKDASWQEIIEWGKDVKIRYQDYKRNAYPNKAIFLPQRKLQDGFIDWNSTSKEIYDFIRALMGPYFPGAFTLYKGKKLFILESEILKERKLIKDEPGQVSGVFEDGLEVKTSDAYIRIKRLRFEGMPEMWANDFVDECGISLGEKLGLDS